jgi:transposase
MLDQSTRTSILRLHEAGQGSRAIARMLGISRGAVKEVLRQGTPEVPRIQRSEKAQALRDDIVSLYVSCKGNLVRVHEELTDSGVRLSYPALTAFCRRQEIGRPPVKPAGHYDFAPGKEMQHDTSMHQAWIAGKLRKVQTASLVLAYSRMLFFQCYPNFNRFTCKTFLAEGNRYYEGACERCMIDNTHVVVLHGTGLSMVAVPEMVAFAERLGFTFIAHEKGDANRSARVERPFDFIENNFLAGRKFDSWEHLNAQARLWCDQKNATWRRHLKASPRELFAIERTALRPRPEWVPEVYALHTRIVDLQGYITLHTNRYSAPWKLIGRPLEVREMHDRIELFEGPRSVATHKRLVEPVGVRVTLPEHRPPRGSRHHAAPSPEEQALCAAAPELAAYVALLKKHATGRGTLLLRRLKRIVDEYPRSAVLAAIGAATQYGLFDLERLERLVLRHVADQFFPRLQDQNPP